MYYLGDEYPGTYLTKRELECLLYLLEGHNIAATGKLLNLSARTVEFYLRNVRIKLNIRNKSKLIAAIRGLPFLRQPDVQEIMRQHGILPPTASLEDGDSDTPADKSELGREQES